MNKISLTALIFGSSLALTGTALAGPECKQGKAPGRMGRLDTNKDGKVTLAELTESKEGWLREVDANKDGVATQAEIEARFHAGRAQRMAKLFERRDTNRDGRLTREESHMPEAWFSRVDTNQDGTLTREELTQRPAHGAAADKGRKGGKLAELDENRDGKIDAAEVKNGAARMLKRLDRNADGSLSADELARHRRPHHRRGPRPGDGKQPSNPASEGAQRS